MSEIDRGVAFICEGQTEEVFYYSLLEHYISINPGYTIKEKTEGDTLERRYILSDGFKSIVIKFYSVGGVIIGHTLAGANWFKNACHSLYEPSWCM